ncbi:LuxR family transcriptional regulator [Amycolatopsis sp. WQ 127309]|uniref:helix-turn-helix transcriptional regulator n=1 Tax=Amycolatopsis sp. WQ 127309 TaxID=2932773 RepID=UPI001FF2CF3E|nr:LuxR family transcriptional regulator [Amycolatopsis sp. WQ 127309]UOZ06960.1 LuxR family transcriptional regulator [Amycolatopsis sp. WQ 127309]
MARQSSNFVGRRVELAALTKAAGSVPLTIVRGAPGSGKSALLTRAQPKLGGGDALTLTIACDQPHPEWDRYGITLLIAAVRSAFELFGGRPRLSEAIDSVVRLCTEAAYRSAWTRYRLLNAVGVLFTRLGGMQRVTVVLDDVDLLAEPEPTLAALQRSGRPLVASCTAGGPLEGLLSSLAGEVVDLEPLAEEEAENLFRKSVNATVDLALRRAVRAALGPLWGNPATLLSTVADLRRQDRLVSRHGAVCLREPDRAITLPPGHHLLTSLAGFDADGRDLVLIAAGPDSLDIDGIPLLAAATGGSAVRFGSRADALVRAGVLEVVAPGRLTCRCPALAASVIEQAGADRVASLHRLMARHLLEAQAGSSRPMSILAEHVAGAGRSLAPRPDLVGLLRDDEVRLQPFDRPAQISHRYAAWWHSEPGPQRQQLRADLVRLLARTGDQDTLADLVEAAPEEASGPDLAAAAALISIFDGRPVPPAIRASLTLTGTPAPIEFADRWLAGAVVRARDVETAFAAIRPPGAPALEFGPDVEAACTIRDLVPVFDAISGPGYRAPLLGAMAAYHRLCSGYAGRDWDEALSAARALDLDPGTPGPLRTRARLLAAEMSSWRGDDRRATAWLDSIERDGPLPALSAWVEVGLRYRGGDDPAGAWEFGLAAYENHAGDDESTSARLLTRLLLIAEDCGERHWVRRTRSEADALHERFGTAWTAEVADLAHGIAENDENRVRRAEEAVRRRGDRFGLALVCFVAGGSAAQPERELTEAYEIAQDLGAAKLVSMTRRVMGQRRMAVPVSRPARIELSDVELRIVELIREGRTNRQIASGLQMSEKTVEKYLTRLYSKVGCRNRYGLATSDLGGWAEPVGA